MRLQPLSIALPTAWQFASTVWVVGMTIPKIVHQTFSAWGDLNHALRSNLAHVKELNKAWDHRFYDDRDIYKFITQTYSSEILAIYERLNPAYPAARADLFRYLLMYEQGGIYLDIKSTLKRPLDQVIAENDCYLLSCWNKQYPWYGKHPDFGVQNEFQQWHIVAAPHHPFLESVIQRVLGNIKSYKESKHGVGAKAVWATTGPIAYTLAINGIRQSHDHRLVDIGELGFRYSIFHTSQHRKLFKNHYAGQKEPLVLKRQRKYWRFSFSFSPPPPAS
jgi:mannosyltransferase OCH1-like enzyme